MTRKHRDEVLRQMAEQVGELPTSVLADCNVTRTAAGPFDPNKSWLDQVLDSCSLDSHDNSSKGK